MKAELLLFLLSGALLGLFFFGGLWLTVRALPALRQPRTVYWAATLLRFTVCLLVLFAAVTRGPLQLTSACAGFLVIRMVLVPLLGQVRSGQREAMRPCG